VQAGKRIRSAVGSEGVLGRLGGDEFAVLLHHCTEARAKVIAQAVTTSLARPFTLGEHEVQSAASLGIALAPDHGQELPTLLRHADVAMYRAKADHLEIVVYDTHQDRNGTHRLHDLQDLRDALDLDQFVLHFQPKIDLIKEQVCGVEALVRWDHPRDGLTYPDAFLPLVEDSGLMRALTRKVLNDAFRQAATWRRGGRPLVVAVNLSASSLLDRDLPDQVQRMLEHHRLPGTAVQLEITEGFLLTDPDQATAVLQRLRRQGIGISLDDFGTGYSSLSYLRNLPLDELKLDRSFVSQMADDGRASALVAATIGLAHSLGLRLVAEGVEDSTTYSELRRLGCDQAQGYHLGRPMPAAELERWLDTPHAFARARGDLAR
jgi:predicted signal transduction protein with EAL and GGDEF domain